MCYVNFRGFLDIFSFLSKIIVAYSDFFSQILVHFWSFLLEKFLDFFASGSLTSFSRTTEKKLTGQHHDSVCRIRSSESRFTRTIMFIFAKSTLFEGTKEPILCNTRYWVDIMESENPPHCGTNLLGVQISGRTSRKLGEVSTDRRNKR